MPYIVASDILAKYDFDATDAAPVLTTLIGEAVSFIENFTGRDFVASTDLETRYFTAQDDAEGLRLFLDDDLLSISSDGITAGTDTIYTTDFVTEPRNTGPFYALTLKSNTSLSWFNPDSDGVYENAIAIPGTWAYATDVPAAINWAVGRLAFWMYKQRSTNADLDRPLLTGDGMTVMPSEAPADVMAVLKHYVKRPVY